MSNTHQWVRIYQTWRCPHLLWYTPFSARKTMQSGNHMVDPRIPPDSFADIDTPGEDIRLVHGPMKRIITSGWKIILRTDDPSSAMILDMADASVRTMGPSDVVFSTDALKGTQVLSCLVRHSRRCVAGSHGLWNEFDADGAWVSQGEPPTPFADKSQVPPLHDGHLRVVLYLIFTASCFRAVEFVGRLNCL